MDLDGAEEDHEMVRKHKALCYEDMVLWVVQDPNGGGRDVLAMEVNVPTSQRCKKQAQAVKII